MGHSDVIVYTKENDFITELLPYNIAILVNFASYIVIKLAFRVKMCGGPIPCRVPG